jgi:hypothetical protein
MWPDLPWKRERRCLKGIERAARYHHRVAAHDTLELYENAAGTFLLAPGSNAVRDLLRFAEPLQRQRAIALLQRGACVRQDLLRL